MTDENTDSNNTGDTSDTTVDDTDSMTGSDTFSYGTDSDVIDTDTYPDITDDPLYDTGSIFTDPGQFAEKIPALADFWITPRDDVNGGFFTYVDITGEPTANTNKSVVTQSRSAYGFVRAFMLTGDETYLENARHALDFNIAHAWDTKNDGWFYELKEDGTITANGQNNQKWSFIQHYALLGLNAYTEATQNTHYKDWLMKGWDSNEEHLWDSDPVNYGYFNYADADWSNPDGKGFTPSADGITTNVLGMSIVMNSPAGTKRLSQLVSNMYDHFITASMFDFIEFGLAEEYNNDWSLNTNSTFGFIGHVLKTAWCLGRGHLVTGDDESDKWLDRASELIMDVWDNGGYDHVNGAPYYSFLWDNIDSIDDSQVEYWQVEQAITSGLINYYASKKQKERAIFLQMAEESMQFFLDYFFDDVNGGIYSRTLPDGTILSDTKGDYYKSAYHGIETLYYGYLYGSLYYANLPVTLCYSFKDLDEDLNVKLTPIAIEDNVLKITSVEKDGEPYADFKSNLRELNVKKGNGGIFKVTFERK
ncbi:MAG: AGE family epimerase/isomerase [Deltaproteobacteria bacterium]|nr:AGE family epimerase/isomerase [Deltaproteobacteria bacterium]